ncbi:hypothetical protein B0H16DRAFT_1723004 [Mycena metata]|uniref:Uncharacterized protein n=1 Tax=Mycena metata TaxID=1033252 RepID=A0AAD7NAN5_9AGAR|nr:hypothetical protein B0H16DRAFT_1723004 [Mycena metata]
MRSTGHGDVLEQRLGEMVLFPPYLLLPLYLGTICMDFIPHSQAISQGFLNVTATYNYTAHCL